MTEGQPLTPDEVARMFPYEREQGGWWEYGHGPDGADKVWRPVRKREQRESFMPAVIHVHHDTEAHARSFNEGYEAAVTQGLADDPTLADDWFQAKLREARAQALENAAQQMREERRSWCLDDAGRYWINRTLDELAERAVAERGEG